MDLVSNWKRHCKNGRKLVETTESSNFSTQCSSRWWPWLVDDEFTIKNHKLTLEKIQCSWENAWHKQVTNVGVVTAMKIPSKAPISKCLMCKLERCVV